MQKRLLSMLTLLLVAVTGAWAQEPLFEEFTTADVTKGQLVFISDHFKITGTRINENGLWIGGDQNNTVTISALKGAKGEKITKVEMTIGSTNGATQIPIATPLNASISGTYAVGQTLTLTGVNTSEFTFKWSGSALTVIKSWKIYYEYIPVPTTNIAFIDGTKDADQWTISPNPAETNQPVTATFSGGTRLVKAVRAKKRVIPPTYRLLSSATTDDYGMVVCAKGHLHTAKTLVPEGCTAVGILGKVTTTGHGLILALKDAAYQSWNTINGWESVTTYANTELKRLPDSDARGENLVSYTSLGNTTVSNWCVAKMDDYMAIFTNLGSQMSDNDGPVVDQNVEDFLTQAGGSQLKPGNFWTVTTYNDTAAWLVVTAQKYWVWYPKETSERVRPVLGF